MSKRTKIIPIIITSRESMESVVADIVRLKLEHVQKQAAMEAEIAEVQKKHQDGILSIAKQIEIKEAGVYIYCSSHRKELFPDDKKKSIDLLLATVGFRNDPPSVGKRHGKDTFGAIALRLEALDWGKDYITYPDPELNKKAILMDHEKLGAEKLAIAGIKIDQDEQFFIKPKSEVAEASVKEAA